MHTAPKSNAKIGKRTFRVTPFSGGGGGGGGGGVDVDV